MASATTAPSVQTARQAKLAIAQKVATIGAHVLRDRVTRPQAASPAEVPWCTEAITAEWLTDVLCAARPGAKVVSVDLGSGSSGTTTGRKLTVTYNDEGTRASLPTELFNKSSKTFTSRLVLGLAGVLPGESGFYSRIRPDLDVEAPVAYYANYDARTWRSSILLDDIAKTKGAVFCTPTTAITRQQIEGMLANLARFHGKFWNSARLNREFEWLRTPVRFESDLALLVNWRKGCTRGLDRAQGVIPAELQADRDRLWRAYRRSLELCGQGHETLLHGDPHLGNWYETAGGVMGICDWQVCLKGSWGHDFTYMLTSALTIEDRRSWEHELVAFYLGRLQASGVVDAPTLNEAWLTYRQQALYGLHAWLATIGRGALQPKFQPDDVSLALIERMSNAVIDLESLDAVIDERG